MNKFDGEWMRLTDEKLEELKTNLFRLHFLLTEQQTAEMILNGTQQFEKCYNMAFGCLADYIFDEYKKTIKAAKGLIEKSAEFKLFNAPTIDLLYAMNKDFEQSQKSASFGEIYGKIQDNYARLLQMIYDMLIRMGEEPPEENE